MKKKSIISIVIILGVIALAIWAMNRPHPLTTEETAKCIGENSVLYIQLGCHACESQERIFGEYYDKLTVVDCFLTQEECLTENIKATPTWKINGEEYIGVRSIAELKDLTGC